MDKDIGAGLSDCCRRCARELPVRLALCFSPSLSVNTMQAAAVVKLSLSCFFPQAFELLDEPVHFLDRVVMHRRHPDDAVRIAEVERLNQAL